MKKRKGNGQYIAFGLVLLAIFALLVYAVDLLGDLEQSRQITDTMRRYMLVMEGNGCLTATEMQALTADLEQIGVRDVTFGGNPQTKVPYGSEVVLSISGTVDALRITGMQDFSFLRAEDGIRFTRTLTSTAQY